MTILGVSVEKCRGSRTIREYYSVEKSRSKSELASSQRLAALTRKISEHIQNTHNGRGM